MEATSLSKTRLEITPKITKEDNSLESRIQTTKEDSNPQSKMEASPGRTRTKEEITTGTKREESLSTRAANLKTSTEMIHL